MTGTPADFLGAYGLLAPWGVILTGLVAGSALFLGTLTYRKDWVLVRYSLLALVPLIALAVAQTYFQYRWEDYFSTSNAVERRNERLEAAVNAAATVQELATASECAREALRGKFKHTLISSSDLRQTERGCRDSATMQGLPTPPAALVQRIEERVNHQQLSLAAETQ